MTEDELVSLREWHGRKPVLTTMGLWKLHKADRKSRRVKLLCVTAFRDVVRGRTYNHVKEPTDLPRIQLLC